MSMLDSGQFEGAILILERQLEKTPDRVDLLEPLAFAQNAAEQEVMAALTFSQIAELSSDPAYFLYAAESLRNAGDATGAVGRYRSYLAEMPNDRAIWVTLAQFEEERGNSRQALEAWLRAERLESRAQHQLAIGRLYLEAGNLAQAQTWHARALEGDESQRPEAFLGLLATAVEARRFKDASLLVAQMDEAYPGFLDASDLADIRSQLEDWEQRRNAARAAVAELERVQAERDAVEQEPPNPEETETMSEPLRNAEAITDSPGEPVEPVEAADPVSEETPEFASTAKAAELPDTGEQEEPVPAEAAAANFVGLSSLDSEVAAEETDPKPESVREPAPSPATEKEVVSLETTSPSPDETIQEHRARAQNLAASGQNEDAIRAYKSLLVKDDRDPADWSTLSRLYIQSGDGRMARATASEAMRRSPDQPEYSLGWIAALLAFREPRQILAEMESVARQFPENPDVLLMMARGYRESPSNERNARILYERYLEFAPVDHPGIGEANSFLNAAVSGR